MKILNLIIKQKYFDEILAGTKKEEYREIRPTTFKKYCQYEIDGKLYDSLDDYPNPEDADFEFEAVPRDYDAIRLFVGYNKDRDSALVEIKESIIEYLEDENGELVSYEHNGEQYLVCQMVYVLGEILEKKVK